MTTPNKHWCPACDQGWVERVTLMPMQQRGWLCGECEALWPHALAKAMATEPFVQLRTWAKEQGAHETLVVLRG